MDILLSAYACEPDLGSEPEVGWKWAAGLSAQGHQVTVLTRKSNREAIERKVDTLPGKENLSFIYYDLPNWLRWWKRGNRGIHLYYLLWQIGIYFVARRFIRKNPLDIIHHVTFVTVRQPSFLGLLGVPFILGPIGGGEAVPRRLRKSFPLRGKVKEFFRDLVNMFVSVDPLMHLSFLSADVIYATSDETRNVIPYIYHNKVKICLAIGSSEGKNDKNITPEREERFRFLYIGRFEYFKGMELGIKAFSLMHESFPDSTMTLVGEGPEELKWRGLVDYLGLNDNVLWHHWVPQERLNEIYLSHDVFIFPSLRDSGGLVVLEALGNGLPVVCFNLGGPGQLVNEQIGIVVDSDGDEEMVIRRFSTAMIQLSEREVLSALRRSARKKIDRFSWERKIKEIYQERIRASG